MPYPLHLLNCLHGVLRHVWIGARSSIGGAWQAAIRFDTSRGTPDEQVRSLLERHLGCSRAHSAFPKVSVGKDRMWQSYRCYGVPPVTLP